MGLSEFIRTNVICASGRTAFWFKSCRRRLSSYVEVFKDLPVVRGLHNEVLEGLIGRCYGSEGDTFVTLPSCLENPPCFQTKDVLGPHPQADV